MKRTLLCVLLLLMYIGIKAQTVSGKVYRDSSQTAISGASVYYGGSMAGTLTDKDGGFELKAKSQKIPITVSCIGYYSATAYYKTRQPLIIYLKPKVEELHDVIIHADGMDRKNEVAIFTREFLGTSEYAQSCIITNLDDVYLFYSKKTKTLTASSDKPIVVENKKLGYVISCYMDNFEKTAKGVHFSGNYIFKEIKAMNPKAQANIQENREDAYDGSQMQLIRALWHLTLNKTYFDLYTVKKDLTVGSQYSDLDEADLMVTDSIGQKYLRFQGSVYIGDSRDFRKKSILTFNAPLSFIDKDGFYGGGLEWAGAMGNQRVGDMLPLEYQSDREAKNTAKASLKTVAKTNSNSAKQELLFEKAYLHTDRDVYAQGDTLWFKAYLVNAQNNKPALSSGNLYVELLAADSAKILDNEIIRLENGLGKGDMALADSLPAGTYRLRAYTNWMRNLGDNFVFEKNITVLNTQAVPEASVNRSSKKSLTKSNKKSKTDPVIAVAIPPPATNNLPIVRFYPEGGSLVSGISSFVGVKAENGYGKGMAAPGAIISAAGDTVSHFTCDSLGIGICTLLPLAGQSYHAVVELGGGRQNVFQLPAALSKGLALQIKQGDTVIHALIHATRVSGNSISMLVKHNGKLVLNQPLTLKDRQAAFKISAASLPEGISAITIYNASNKPECERLIYVHHVQNDIKNKVTITTDKKIYQPKEKVDIQITTAPNSTLSMAVVDASVVPVQDGDIVSYLNLQSEIKGAIENPDRYFDTTNVNRFKQLDQLLLTQGWRDFVWRRMADTTIRISYATENGITVSGKIWDEVRNKILPGANVTLYADSAKGTKLFSATTNKEGRFYFDGLMLYGQQNINLGSVDNSGKDKGTILVDTLTPLPIKPIRSRPAFLQNSLDSIAKVNTEKKVETMRIAHVSGITNLKAVTIKNRKVIITRSVNVLTSREPDQIFNISSADYQYKTLEWYMLQKVKGAHESSRPYHGIVPTGVEFSGADTLLIKTPAVSFYVSQTVLMPPQIFVNGQELNMDGNTDMDMNIQAEAYRTQYFNMPMNKFKTVVLKHMSGTIHGLSANGKALLPSAELINVDRFLLYLTMQDNYTIDNPGALNTNVNGYYQARTFYEPSPNAKPSIADYRSTIHWQPDIKTDTTGKATVSFYNAVPSTTVRVIVEGITDSGTPLSSTSIYKIE